MPTKYNLTCHIDERWVKEWGGDDSLMKFCFGAAMNDNESIGVVAYADVVAGSITVDRSKPEASHLGLLPQYWSAFTDLGAGVALIAAATDYASIDYGQEYTVDRTWVESTASNSARAPENGFFFRNINTPAAAVVAKRINGELRPFYISPVLLPPAGKDGGDKLIPNPTVAVWFQMNANSGTMIERDTVQQFYIRVEAPEMRVKFAYDGTWSNDTKID